jgi:ADP-ribose pyrophosphatase
MDDLETRLKETRLSSKPVFSGRMINVRVDTVLLPDGKQASREVVDHPGAVVVLPLTENQEVIMVRQFRYPVGEILWELPAGKRDGDEEPLNCARRELEEETGYQAREWRELFAFYTTPGFTNELLHLILARGLKVGDAHPDSEEFIEVIAIPLSDARRMIRRGEIRDAKTIIGILALEDVEI